ncbi:MAG: ATP--guanido phosphotransferase [bacterium]
MRPADLGGRLAEWLDGTGPSSDVVLSSRVRLARNLGGIPFPNRADDGRLSSTFDAVAAAVHSAKCLGRAAVWDLDELSAWDRRLLIERHLATARLAEGRGRRGVCVAPGERLGMMINEEDHLRIQSVVSGFDLAAALRGAVELDLELETALDYAVSPDRGYLTACPTNVGTGMRGSVLVHLPGLVLAGEIRKVHRAVAEMGMAVRGWFGEGSAALGDFHQVSNQRKLGPTEEEIVEELGKVCRRILELELEAREQLVTSTSRRRRLEDRVHRSWAILRSARLLTVESVMACASDVRFGKWMGRFEAVPTEKLNRLALLTQPAHLGRSEGRVLSGEEADWARARLVRAEFADFPVEG